MSREVKPKLHGVLDTCSPTGAVQLDHKDNETGLHSARHNAHKTRTLGWHQATAVASRYRNSKKKLQRVRLDEGKTGTTQDA